MKKEAPGENAYNKAAKASIKVGKGYKKAAKKKPFKKGEYRGRSVTEIDTINNAKNSDTQYASMDEVEERNKVAIQLKHSDKKSRLGVIKAAKDLMAKKKKSKKKVKKVAKKVKSVKKVKKTVRKSKK